MTDCEYKAVNRKARLEDESHLWPICGKFNVAQRAINTLRRQIAKGLVFDDVLSYEAALDNEMSRIVNDQANW